MSLEGQTIYPGETATPRQLLDLADEYRRAAEALMQTGRPRMPLSYAPYRLVAIHAVELYLNAFLLAEGHSATTLRGLHHNLSRRTELALDAKLPLRLRTVNHLRRLSETREYLVTRYDPATNAETQLNGLAATLTDVARKVRPLIAGSERSILDRAARPTPAPPSAASDHTRSGS
jgi:hypothetical protein